MNEATLKRNLKLWAEEEVRIAEAQAKNNEFKKKIEAEVLRTEKEIRIEDGPKCIITGSGGSYLWIEIANEFKPTQEQIQACSTVAWNKVADLAAPNKKALEESKKKHYVSGIVIAQCRVR